MYGKVMWMARSVYFGFKIPEKLNSNFFTFRKFYFQINPAQQALACKPTEEFLLEKINY